MVGIVGDEYLNRIMHRRLLLQLFGLPFSKFVKLVVLAIIQKLCFMVSTLNRAVGLYYLSPHYNVGQKIGSRRPCGRRGGGKNGAETQ
jgi:hypothetical protein